MRINRNLGPIDSYHKRRDRCRSGWRGGMGMDSWVAWMGACGGCRDSGGEYP